MTPLINQSTIIKLGARSVKGLANFDYNLMRKIAKAPIGAFNKYGKKFNTPHGRYFFQDKGKQILGIAHLDTVCPFTHFSKVKLGNDTRIFCPTLDDRLGAYLLLEYLPLMGINYDVLLTEGEEKGRSTAEFFNASKEYNWMFSFDARGINPILYQYSDKRMIERVIESGFEQVQKGIYSDIAHLEHLECKGINFGCGIGPLMHSFETYTSINDLRSSLLGFLNFYNKYSNSRLYHLSKPPKTNTTNKSSTSIGKSSAVTTIIPNISDKSREEKSEFPELRTSTGIRVYDINHKSKSSPGLSNDKKIEIISRMDLLSQPGDFKSTRPKPKSLFGERVTQEEITAADTFWVEETTNNSDFEILEAVLKEEETLHSDLPLIVLKKCSMCGGAFNVTDNPKTDINICHLCEQEAQYEKYGFIYESSSDGNKTGIFSPSPISSKVNQEFPKNNIEIANMLDVFSYSNRENYKEPSYDYKKKQGGGWEWKESTRKNRRKIGFAVT